MHKPTLHKKTSKISSQAPPYKAPAQSTKISSTKTPLILSVDDEDDIRASIKQVLEDENFRVETAENGQALLEKLEKIKPDLILLDILMPGLTTREILDSLDKKKIKIPIIFLTVVRLAEATKKQIMRGNTVDYIEKPFDNTDLINRIRKALRLKGAKRGE